MIADTGLTVRGDAAVAWEKEALVVVIAAMAEIGKSKMSRR
jgi:hypothetical protein